MAQFIKFQPAYRIYDRRHSAPLPDATGSSLSRN
jgi:hypothetical protein